jgi:glutathione S-transferase
LAYIGSEYGLLPNDNWERARHLGVLTAVEELRALLEPTGRISDEDEKKKVRQELASSPMRQWAANVERQIEGPFVGGQQLQVTDLKVFTALRWIKNGIVDHVPTDVFDDYPKLNALFSAVSEHPKVGQWRAKFD